MLHKVTNVEKQYKSPVNTKHAKHKGCVKKVYQGVNVALDHEAKTNHIGNCPHILPNQNIVRTVKIGSQRASYVNTGKKTGNTWSRATECHSTSSPTQAESEGKISHNHFNDFVSKNKFAVLAELDVDANMIQNHVCDTTAGENVANPKVSSGNKKQVPHVSEGVVSRVVGEFPLTEDKYDLQAMFQPRHRSTITAAETVKTFQTWNAQTTDKYGFIPLGDLMLPESNEKNQSDESIFSIHDKICRSGHFNFM